jgi:hypothetical protein
MRSEEYTREARARHSWVRSSLLRMSSGDPSKLLTLLNILITGKFGLGACLVGVSLGECECDFQASQCAGVSLGTFLAGL